MTTFSVAKPRMAAGAIFLNPSGELMMVRPTYKDYWDIPGGYVEPGESPLAACKREVHEELGILPTISHLLVVDWAPNSGEGDKVLWVFKGETLSGTHEAEIELDGTEIAEYQFVSKDRLAGFTIERLSKRLLAALRANESGSTAYLESGEAC